MHRAPRLVYSIVCLVLLGALAAPAFAVGPPPFTTTHLISGANPPLVNGANLLAAVAGAGPNTLIKLEPGIYDLGGDQIVLPDFVDIEGSGRDITTIFSDLSIAATPTVIDVASVINGEVRELTVAASATNNATGITTQSDELLLTEVNLEIEAGAQATGVIVRNASPRLDEVFVRILGAGGNATAFQVEGGGPVIFSCLAFLSNVTRNAIGYAVNESTAILESSIAFALFNGSNTGVLVSGTTTQATVRGVRAIVQGADSVGIQVQKQATARVKESSFQVQSANFAAGIRLEDGTAKVTETTFLVSPLPGVFILNAFGALLRGSSNLDSNQSNYESSSFAVQNNGSGQARFGASQLIGNAVPAVPASLTCVFSYFGNYTPRNAVCN